MKTQQWVNDLFQAIDTGDMDAFAGFLSEDVSFRMGNFPTVNGRESVVAGVSGFMSGIKGTKHELSDTLICGETLVVHGSATYTRLNGSELTVPFANILYLNGEKIRDYLIFVNNADI